MAATKQALAEAIAQRTRGENDQPLSAEEQAALVAQLVKSSTRDELLDRLKAVELAVPPTPSVEVEPAAAASVAIVEGERLDLLRRTLANGLTDDEFSIFAARCNQAGLDPFANQIHAVKRQGKLCIQTGIDGFRLIADRTGNYAGSDDPLYEGEAEYRDGGNTKVAPARATVTVRKIVQGQVFEVTRHAYWAEFFPKNDSEAFMWKRMPHVMLAKCAEAQALRAAFPADLSGLYADEEMHQADVLDVGGRVRDEPTHAEPVEVERWRRGLRAAINAAETADVDRLVERWRTVEPKLSPLDKIDTMREMRRATAITSQTLRVKIEPLDPEPTEQPPIDADDAKAHGEASEPCVGCGEPLSSHEEPAVATLDGSYGGECAPLTEGDVSR